MLQTASSDSLLRFRGCCSSCHLGRGRCWFDWCLLQDSQGICGSVWSVVHVTISSTAGGQWPDTCCCNANDAWSVSLLFAMVMVKPKAMFTIVLALQ